MDIDHMVYVWNEKYPVGTPVELTDDFGDVHQTKTRSVAWVINGDTALIQVEGKRGGYLLDRIKAVV